MSAHWVGCIFYFLARTQDFDSSTWLAGLEKLNTVPLYRAPKVGEPYVWSEYLLCVYKGFNRLTAVGYEGITSDVHGHSKLHANAHTSIICSHKPSTCTLRT
jgi:hypothetical protein